MRKVLALALVAASVLLMHTPAETLAAETAETNMQMTINPGIEFDAPTTDATLGIGAAAADRSQLYREQTPPTPAPCFCGSSYMTGLADTASAGTEGLAMESIDATLQMQDRRVGGLAPPGRVSGSADGVLE